ncbi:hypothetical protein H7I77_13400 [Mycolicibacterium novocastrense]|uniref:HTH iclR-type domain-containing protein n=1 Tax=Mycolicibacterium novocastrense TaxID=59813 RepID=A0AAW5SKV0_MYCNV|nr:hypothetical protein [Mycolicibacterium novocastrense]MCV7024332.1 hypothetical protein [Mycolicibacterium novocastrense]GAT08067.1 hypothetical protein RMCN_1200 [Mycolicibacterium novocastrense]
MIADTWTTRDLPVLRAAVEIYDRTGRNPSAAELGAACEFDEDTVQRALRALYREPFFEKGMDTWGGGILAVGPPTSAALRIAGQWPTPEGQLDRLIAAFEAVAADDSRTDEERSRAAKIGLWLSGALQQVAIGALGGAGGNMLSG